MNRMLWVVWIAAVLFSLTGNANEKVLLDQPVICSFQYNQYMDNQKAETDTQDSVLEWSFSGLLGSQPVFHSGGDTGSISVHHHKRSDGVSIWLRQGNGAHLFSIWPDGTAFWSKHNDLFGSKATQQFRGTCMNVRRTD